MDDAARGERIAAQLSVLAGEMRRSDGASEDRAADFLREAIHRGILRPGWKINQEEISDLLAMSRIPVRAAVRRLEAEGLISAHRFRGAAVRTRSIDEIEEIYDLRTTVECWALLYVAQSLDRTRSASLRRLVEKVDSPNLDSMDWLDQHRLFYRELFSGMGKPRIYAEIRSLRAEIVGHIVTYAAVRPHAGHSELLDMLESGDIDAARSSHRAHLARLKNELRAALEFSQSHRPRQDAVQSAS